jgi:hypothetical protein
MLGALAFGTEMRDVPRSFLSPTGHFSFQLPNPLLQELPLGGNWGQTGRRQSPRASKKLGSVPSPVFPFSSFPAFYLEKTPVTHFVSSSF